MKGVVEALGRRVKHGTGYNDSRIRRSLLWSILLEFVRISVDNATRC